MNIETIIISGSDADLEAAMEADTALVVDHRSQEEEVLSELVRLLPGFSGGGKPDRQGVFHASMCYLGREVKKSYGNVPHNCFRVVLDAAELIHPDAEIRVYEPTAGDDTHVFVAAPAAFWSRFDSEASPKRKSLFGLVQFLVSAWEMNGPVSGTASKPWWKFWA